MVYLKQGPLLSTSRWTTHGDSGVGEEYFADSILAWFAGTTMLYARLLDLDNPIRKLKKAVAVSRVCSGVPEENSEKVREKCWKTFPKSERQTSRDESWVDPALDLVPTFCAGCFSKSTVPAFSSFSDRILGGQIMTLQQMSALSAHARWFCCGALFG